MIKLSRRQKEILETLLDILAGVIFIAGFYFLAVVMMSL